MWKQVILVIVDFHRVNIANRCCPIYEVAVRLARCVGITSLTDSLPLKRGDSDKIENGEGGAW